MSESQPNIDFFSRVELRAVIKKFKQDTLEGKLDDVSEFLSLNLKNSRSSSVMLDSSTAQMFDIALNRPRTQSNIRRKQTKLVEDTVLSRNNGTQCVVTGINQFITSQVGGYMRSQTQMITIETYPMKWQVKRLDSDFETLREYLLRSYPQTIIPPLPNSTKKKLSYNQTTKRMGHY